MADCALGLLRYIDLALAQALDQVLRRQVDNFDVVRLVENAVGHGFAHANARDPGDDVVEAFDMLNVESGEDIDAGGNQLLDVEVALRMPAAWRVSVGKFVDQHELRAALEDRVEIHFGEEMSYVVDLLPWNHLEAFQQHLSLAPPVSFDDADDDIDAIAPPGLGRQQHLVCLANPRSCPQENFQVAAALLFCRGEQCLW